MKIYLLATLLAAMPAFAQNIGEAVQAHDTAIKLAADAALKTGQTVVVAELDQNGNPIPGTEAKATPSKEAEVPQTVEVLIGASYGAGFNVRSGLSVNSGRTKVLGSFGASKGQFEWFASQSAVRKDIPQDPSDPEFTTDGRRIEFLGGSYSYSAGIQQAVMFSESENNFTSIYAFGKHFGYFGSDVVAYSRPVDPRNYQARFSSVESVGVGYERGTRSSEQRQIGLVEGVEFSYNYVRLNLPTGSSRPGGWKIEAFTTISIGLKKIAKKQKTKPK